MLVVREYPRTPEIENLPPETRCRVGEEGVRLGKTGSVYVADVAFEGLCKIGKEIRLGEVGEVIVRAGSLTCGSEGAVSIGCTFDRGNAGPG